MGAPFHTGVYTPAYSSVVPLSPFADRAPFSSELRPSGRTALLRSMTFGSGLFFSSIAFSSEFRYRSWFNFQFSTFNFQFVRLTKKVAREGRFSRQKIFSSQNGAKFYTLRKMLAVSEL